MRARGQGPLAIAAVAVLVAAGVTLDRLGTRAPEAPRAGAASSGAWFCPYGGGKGWTATIFVANPADRAATVRVTPIGSGRTGQVTAVRLPPDAEAVVPVPATDRAASALVEYFGPWVAAGWVAHAGGTESGVAAEPCADASAGTWLAPDGTTAEGEDAFLIVMNPYAAEARFDVVLYTKDRAPIRDSKLTPVTLKPFRSVAIHVNQFAEGEAPVSAEVHSTDGRVAVSSLGVTRAGGVRSAIGVPATEQRVLLPGGGDQGQSELVVLVPGSRQGRLGATTVGSNGLQPAGGLTDAQQGGQSARQYEVITDGPGAVSVDANGGGPGFAAARRLVGPGGDPGATDGTTASSRAWVVMPTVAGEPSKPGLYLTNPSAQAVDVTLHALVARGGPAPSDVTVTVPADATVAAPDAFLRASPNAAVLATSASGDFVPVGASSSTGALGIAGYAVSVGVPVPAGPG